MERLTGWGVVALWGAFNAVFAALLIGFILGGFGSSTFDIEAYASATGLVFAFALAVWLARRRRPGPQGWMQPAGAASVVLFAAGAMLAWLGMSFGIWVSILGAFCLFLAVVLELTIRSRKA